jgi:hypothetical protein
MCGTVICIGGDEPRERKVLAPLLVSGMLSKESIEAGGAPFVEMLNMIRNAVWGRIFSEPTFRLS